MTSVIMIAPLNAANFESGNAPDTYALFSDGEGGTEFREPAGGGGGGSGVAVAPFLGYIESPTRELINIAYENTVGSAPENGAIATFNWDGEFSTVVYWADQGMWNLLSVTTAIT